ncbi:acetylxylan esterase [candidate division KSB1 bacterium]
MMVYPVPLTQPNGKPIRRSIAVLSLVLALSLGTQATATPAATSLDSLSANVLAHMPEYRDAGIMVQKYLDRIQSEYVWKHNVEFARVKTEADFERLRERLLEDYNKALGVMPTEKTPLKAQVTGVIERDEFRVEKVVFQSRPNFYVTADLFLPKDVKTPRPAVLIPCGHSWNGKASRLYQSAAQFLARKGYVALCFDPVGQGERRQYPVDETTGEPILRDPVLEHCLAGNICFITGHHLMGVRIWDAIRSLDYLISRPEVDPDRIGITGNSGGGTSTLWYTPIEPRIKVAVPVGTVGEWGGGDAEQNLPNDMLTGLSHAALMSLAYPRPYRLIKESRGGVRGDTRQSFHKAKWLYETLGQGEKMDLVETNRQHGYFKEMREPMMEWMNRWLGDPDAEWKEPELELFPDSMLHASPTGQVNSSYNSDTVADICLRHAQKTLPSRKPAKNKAANETLRVELASLILNRTAIERPENPLKVREVWTGQSEGINLRQAIIESEYEVYLPVLIGSKPGSGDKPTVLLISERGKSGELELFRRLVAEGHTVAAVDLRGYGESKTTALSSRDRSGGWMAQLLGTESMRYGYGARHTGRTFIGFRIYDLLQTMKALPQLGLDNQAVLIARGGTGILALQAAVIDPNIKAVCVWRSLTSYMDLIRTPLYHVRFYDMVPNVMDAYDLPDLAAALAPKPLALVSPIDPKLELAGKSDVESAYKSAAATYKNLKAAKSFAIETADNEAGEIKSIVGWLAKVR